FDPTTPSRLDALIAQSDTLPDAALARARALRHHLCASGLSKYNLTKATSSVPSVDGQRRVLVVGQVADDASLRLGGAPGVDTAGLLRQARAAHPDAFLIYKPHPDVEAGLRPGLLEAPEADWVARNAAIVPLIESAEHLWTISSLAGFEALLRKVPVTCLGRPFYAGWGLTVDLGPPIDHRTARPSLDQLVHAVLIDYPHYVHPQTGLALSVEAAVELLSQPALFQRSRKVTGLAGLQQRFRGLAPLWRGAKR
ncbi:MAG: capsular polysaccharide biosynthesis protein, partial [Pseudomonadota bacterium]